MGLKDVLQKMKLVEAEGSTNAAPPPSSPPAGATRSNPRPAAARDEMRDILDRIEPPRLDTAKVAPAAAGQGGGPSFEEVFRAAGIQAPAHGFSAYKVLEIVSSPDLAALDAKSKAQALAAFLKMNPSGPVPIRDVISDAVRRDQALDKFEEFLRQKLQEKAAKAEQESARLQAEIDALLQQKRDAQEKGKLALEEETRRFTEWQARKRIEERKLYDAVAPFVEENPISLGSPAEES
jgi:ElaB/YqjD/DUF883 family membrane-anchored ribosome-binding protein